MLAMDGWGQSLVRQTVQTGLTGPVDPASSQGAHLQLVGRLVDPLRFPPLASAGPEALDDDDEDFFDEEFANGLALLLDGIEALIARSGSGRARRQASRRPRGPQA